MTRRSRLSRGAAAAATFASLLLLAPIPQAAAGSGAGVKTTTTGTNPPGPRTVVATRDHRGEARPIQRSADRPFVYGTRRVVRDHRRNPEPWPSPRHGTPH